MSDPHQLNRLSTNTEAAAGVWLTPYGGAEASPVTSITQVRSLHEDYREQAKESALCLESGVAAADLPVTTDFYPEI